MEFNLYGIALLMAFYIPKLILLFKPPIKRLHHKPHNQMRIIELICELGLSFFGIFSVFGYGYKPYNIIIEVIWIVLMVLLFLLYYICYIRFFIKKRKEEYLYDKFIIYSPIAVIKVLIYLLSGLLLLNPYVIVFSIGFGISHIYINIKKNFE